MERNINDTCFREKKDQFQLQLNFFLSWGMESSILYMQMICKSLVCILNRTREVQSLFCQTADRRSLKLSYTEQSSCVPASSLGLVPTCVFFWVELVSLHSSVPSSVASQPLSAVNFTLILESVSFAPWILYLILARVHLSPPELMAVSPVSISSNLTETQRESAF